jgi:hypothetical protein
MSLKMSLKKLPAEVIFNSIKMQRASGRPVVLVEGETDVSVFKYLCGSAVDVIDANGKVNALRVAKLCDQGNVPWVRVVVDADYDRLLDRLYDSPRVMYTDLNDLECTMVGCGVLEQLSVEIISDASLVRLSAELGGRDLRQALIEGAATIGKYRLANEIGGFGLRFRNMPASQLLMRDRFEVDETALRQWITDANPESRDVGGLWRLVDGDSLNQFEALELCNGHDLVELLAAFTARFGPDNQRAVWERPNLETLLRIGFRGCCERSELVRALQAWVLKGSPAGNPLPVPA